MKSKIQFTDLMPHAVDEDGNFLRRVIYSDETTFHISNTQHSQ
jgi:hypothetical protein